MKAWSADVILNPSTPLTLTLQPEFQRGGRGLISARAYEKLIREQLLPLISLGLGAAVYTQFSDVEIESNGFFTYDRELLKIDRDVVATLNAEIYKAFGKVEGKKPAAEE